ncbi:hypothetical protein ACN4EK_01910 [Pantanalinema rosaneae CENA516]|uniref:hypothetical protein n=1 Tax=Pantanalinema rosaneae TaxID=1620701 RepID=UPI003D6F1829
MTTKPRGSRGTTVKQAAIDDAQSALQGLPEKPKEKLSLKEAVEKLKAPLQAALAKGYSYQELAMMLKENDIVISAATLKNYVPVGKRAAKSQSTATKPRRGTKKAEAQDDDDAIEEQLNQAAHEISTSTDTNNGATAATTPTRRGRSSSKAEAPAKKGRGKTAATEEEAETKPTRRRSSATKGSTRRTSTR